MKEGFLRQGEEILWEAKPEYSMSVFVATLVHALVIPMLFIVAILLIIGFGIFFKLVDASLLTMLSCVFMPSIPWIGWNLLKGYFQVRGIHYLVSNQRLLVVQGQQKVRLKLEWSEVQAAEDTLRSDGLHQVQINHLFFQNLRDTTSLLSLIRQYAPHTFIQQTKANDTLETQLRADEDILWQGSPATTAAHWRELVSPGGIIIFLLFASMGILARDNTVALFAWILFISVLSFLNVWFKMQKISRFYAHKLYMISNWRLIIADSKQNKILFWSPMESVSDFAEIQDVHQLYTLDFGYGFAFFRLNHEAVKEITRVLAPYVTKSEKNKL